MNIFDTTINQILAEAVNPSKQTGPPYIVTDAFGDTLYYKDSKHTILHRDNGPAVEYEDGSEAWYQNNKLHRVGGPAITLDYEGGNPFVTVDVTFEGGDKGWYQNDKLHRLDGPAIERHNGKKLWYVNGNRLTLKEIEEIKKRLAIKAGIQAHSNNRIDPGMLEEYL